MITKQQQLILKLQEFKVNTKLQHEIIQIISILNSNKLAQDKIYELMKISFQCIENSILNVKLNLQLTNSAKENIKTKENIKKLRSDLQIIKLLVTEIIPFFGKQNIMGHMFGLLENTLAVHQLRTITDAYLSSFNKLELNDWIVFKDIEKGLNKLIKQTKISQLLNNAAQNKSYEVLKSYADSIYHLRNNNVNSDNIVHYQKILLDLQAVLFDTNTLDSASAGIYYRCFCSLLFKLLDISLVNGESAAFITLIKDHKKFIDAHEDRRLRNEDHSVVHLPFYLYEAIYFINDKSTDLKSNEGRKTFLHFIGKSNNGAQGIWNNFLMGEYHFKLKDYQKAHELFKLASYAFPSDLYIVMALLNLSVIVNDNDSNCLAMNRMDLILSCLFHDQADQLGNGLHGNSNFNNTIKLFLNYKIKIGKGEEAHRIFNLLENKIKATDPEYYFKTKINLHLSSLAKSASGQAINEKSFIKNLMITMDCYEQTIAYGLRNNLEMLPIYGKITLIKLLITSLAWLQEGKFKEKCIRRLTGLIEENTVIFQNYYPIWEAATEIYIALNDTDKAFKALLKLSSFQLLQAKIYYRLGLLYLEHKNDKKAALMNFHNAALIDEKYELKIQEILPEFKFNKKQADKSLRTKIKQTTQILNHDDKSVSSQDGSANLITLAPTAITDKEQLTFIDSTKTEELAAVDENKIALGKHSVPSVDITSQEYLIDIEDKSSLEASDEALTKATRSWQEKIKRKLAAKPLEASSSKDSVTLRWNDLRLTAHDKDAEGNNKVFKLHYKGKDIYAAINCKEFEDSASDLQKAFKMVIKDEIHAQSSHQNGVKFLSRTRKGAWILEAKIHGLHGNKRLLGCMLKYDHKGNKYVKPIIMFIDLNEKAHDNKKLIFSVEQKLETFLNKIKRINIARISKADPSAITL
ncbi:hypothetical protein [Rickettsiales endosymbiont of Stachyamoeba lipophora]|uniref:hypothetical protein n=1 Tax=Rickettsiales endosymbiont of Stachyamoeba lipophora TaxID=2486578 RepID=UPI000F651B3F|nr:hypothetical protein [Rickettsiales endosymbiont of Stachyamoeba lipophora]AZL16313.1 hypothetical protein EF513_07220 [Rickettsiales endosymbiont of Stachyamoeba lipophora]